MAKCLTNFTLNGILSDCMPNLAGISEVYIGYYGDFDMTMKDDASGHSITTISAATGATSGKFYKYEFAKNTGGLTSTLTKDESNGVRAYTNTINLQFTKLEEVKHMEMQALGAEKLIVIVGDNNKDGNGNFTYWLVGYDGYVSASDQTAQTGSSAEDLNGYTTTLEATSAYLPFKIEKSQFEGLIA